MMGGLYRYRFPIAAALIAVAAPLAAQVGIPPSAPLPAVVLPASPPATRLEGFQPEPDSVVTFAYEELGKIAGGRIVVDVRELRDSRGQAASGVTVHVIESSGSRHERAFVDADELPALMRGLDAVLKVAANPTQLKRFEARYTTRGHLTLVAYSNNAGIIEYSVQAGRPLPATVLNIDAVEILKIRGMFELAMQKLGVAMP